MENTKALMQEDFEEYLSKLDEAIARYEREGRPTFFLDCQRAQIMVTIDRIKEIKHR